MERHIRGLRGTVAELVRRLQAHVYAASIEAHMQSCADALWSFRCRPQQTCNGAFSDYCHPRPIGNTVGGKQGFAGQDSVRAKVPMKVAELGSGSGSYQGQGLALKVPGSGVVQCYRY